MFVFILDVLYGFDVYHCHCVQKPEGPCTQTLGEGAAAHFILSAFPMFRGSCKTTLFIL